MMKVELKKNETKTKCQIITAALGLWQVKCLSIYKSK